MQIEPTALPEVLILTPRRFGDARGWFMETWSAARMADAGLDLPWVQDNHSFSAAKGTLRGLHFQSPPRAQDKLVRCTRGAILDVAVDIRSGSPTYGQHVAVELTPDNGRQLFVPKGFLSLHPHGIPDECWWSGYRGPQEHSNTVDSRFPGPCAALRASTKPRHHCWW